MAKNYDDHVKNISFLMNRQGKWSLAPAYDMTFSYNPNSIWTSKHQMQMNGKRSDILLDDLVECGKSMDITDRKIKEIVKQVICAVQKWSGYAETAGLDERCMQQIGEHHRHALNP